MKRPRSRVGVPDLGGGPLPLNLEWGEHERDGERHLEWHLPCGCAVHPIPTMHVHRCAEHSPQPTAALGCTVRIEMTKAGSGPMWAARAHVKGLDRCGFAQHEHPGKAALEAVRAVLHLFPPGWAGPG